MPSLALHCVGNPNTKGLMAKTTERRVSRPDSIHNVCELFPDQDGKFVIYTERRTL